MSKLLGGKKPKQTAAAEESSGWNPIITPLSEKNPSSRNNRTKSQTAKFWPVTMLGGMEGYGLGG